VFVGHFALGLAAKRVTPRVSLAVLFAAAEFADLVWPFLLAVGLEQVRIQPGNTAFTPLEFVSYPYSHSLLLLVVWGAAFGFAYRLIAHRNGRTVAVIAGLVVSHWVLDVLTHRPDMPLYPGGPKLGLGLWNSIPATVTIELLMYAAGVWIYLRATRARDRIGRWGFGSLAVFLVVAYAANIVGGAPPSVTALAITAFAGSVLILVWSWWADRHREADTLPPRT
jgi:hypothetical protein